MDYKCITSCYQCSMSDLTDSVFYGSREDKNHEIELICTKDKHSVTEFESDVDPKCPLRQIDLTLEEWVEKTCPNVKKDIEITASIFLGEEDKNHIDEFTRCCMLFIRNHFDST